MRAISDILGVDRNQTVERVLCERGELKWRLELAAWCLKNSHDTPGARAVVEADKAAKKAELEAKKAEKQRELESASWDTGRSPATDTPETGRSPATDEPSQPEEESKEEPDPVVVTGPSPARIKSQVMKHLTGALQDLRLAFESVPADGMEDEYVRLTIDKVRDRLQSLEYKIKGVEGIDLDAELRKMMKEENSE
jgi:hypothetical protein